VAKNYILKRSQWVPQPLDTVFEFFSRAENLQTITPPWLEFRMVDAPKQMHAGSLIRYQLRVHKIPVRWTTEITEWNPPHRFVDIELSGPYALWHHEHKFFAENNGTTIEDEVTYALPFGLLGQIACRLFVSRDLENIFDYRARKMRELFGE
jgi:ligand-binding SRPBCC domain-containing protein